MRTAKQIFALLMSLTMILALGITAFADGNTYFIKINQSETDHTYEVYQIFKGDLNEGVLSNIQWGSGISSSGQSHFNQVPGNTSQNAAGYAKLLAEGGATAAAAFAKFIAEDYLGTSSGTLNNSNSYQKTDLVPGYYLVKETSTSLTTGEAMTSYILEVVQNVTANPKNTGVPDVEKEITEELNNKTSEASIGDTVHFKITCTIPGAAANYNYYKLVIADKLDTGLDFGSITSVTINGVPASIWNEGSSTGDYQLRQTPNADGKTFKLALTDAKSHAGQTVIIEYTATLNEHAEIGGSEGNKNTATTQYSNNPNYEYNSEPFPGLNDPMGEKPEVTTQTFTTGLTLHKVDGNHQPLQGASFKISGSGVKTVLVSKEIFGDNPDGEYWKLNDGTYTKTDPNTPGVDQSKYESLTTKYSKSVTTELKNATSSGVNSNVEAAVGPDGELFFNGLGAGDYTITETVTPPGYNTIDPIAIRITFNPTDKTFSLTRDGEPVVGVENLFSMEVINNSGATLPSTGGIGTTIFYVLGGALILGALVLLITRKRIGTDD